MWGVLASDAADAKRVRCSTYVLLSTAIAAWVVAIADTAKLALFPGTAHWGSQYLTLVLVSLLSAGAAWAALHLGGRAQTQYRLLFDANPVPMWVFDRDTLRFLAVNHAALRQYGFSEEEFLAMTIADIRPAEYVAEMMADIAKRRRGLQKPGVWKHRKKDGTLIDVDVVCHGLEFSGTHAMLVAACDITEQVRSRELLQDRESKYRALFEDSPDACWLLDEKGTVVDCNFVALEMFGCRNKAEFRHPCDFSPPTQPNGADSRAAAEEKIQLALAKGKERFEWLHQRANGQTLLADVQLSSLTVMGKPMLVASVRDISERKRAEEALLFKTALLEAESETTIDGILAVDASDRIVLVNKQFASQFEVPEEILRSGDDRRLRQYTIDQIEDPEAFLDRIRHLSRHIEEKSRDELRLKNGRIFDRYSAPLIDSSGQYRGRIWYHRDITERKAAEARVQFLAFYDALTGLPNRTLLKDRLKTALAGAYRRNEKVAVLFLDLDRFKIINDSLGHSRGDQVLEVVARRLQECVREQDTVSRAGGDEFIVVLNGIAESTDAAVIAERIVQTLTERILVGVHSLNTSCSLGVSLFPEDGADCETLIKYADQAMYRAKEAGRNNFRFFTRDLNVEATERLRLVNHLHRALQRDEFELLYQPQIDIASGAINGMEALIRWHSPEMGFVPPDTFIRAAENSGLILPIGDWVLRTACAQVRAWQMEGVNIVPVAVNVSAVQFSQTGFAERIRQVLDDTSLSPEYLELELTESVLVSNADVTLSILSELTSMGVKVAIDDFGTGYSSLSYLRQFRVNRLKIDRSFIRNLTSDSGDAAITTAIIGIAKTLGLAVVAEGVETEAQMSFLRESQCDGVQGFYFSKPIPAMEIAKLLQPGSDRSPAARAIGRAFRASGAGVSDAGVSARNGGMLWSSVP